MGQLFGNSLASTTFSRLGKELKKSNQKMKVPADFCSPIIVTGSRGYSLYVRLFPLDAKWQLVITSVFVALIPGMYDAILKWPFQSTIKISVISPHDAADRWTRNRTASGVHLRVKETCRLVYCTFCHTSETIPNFILNKFQLMRDHVLFSGSCFVFILVTRMNQRSWIPEGGFNVHRSHFFRRMNYLSCKQLSCFE